MPHLTLEYTANLDEWAGNPGLLVDLHRLLAAVGIKIENCKSRWRMVEEWVVADGEGPAAFVHLDIRFLEGRSPQVKQAIGNGALDLLYDHFARGVEGLEGLDFQITGMLIVSRSASHSFHDSGSLR